MHTQGIPGASYLSNFDSRKPCNVFGMCIHPDPSIRDFPKGKEKSIQNIAGGWNDIPGYDRYKAAHDKYMKGIYLVYSELCFYYFWIQHNM